MSTPLSKHDDELLPCALGAATPNGINSLLVSLFIPDLPYDSWVTIGLEGCSKRCHLVKPPLLRCNQLQSLGDQL